MLVKEITKPIEVQLKEFNVFFKKMMKSDVSLLNLIISYLTRKRGKQIRPAMVLLSAELCGGISERSYIGASMVELLHTATLIHDDVVDESKERRGMASVNAIWNNKIAVLIGDYLLAKGLLAAIDKEEFGFLKATSHAVRRMSEGELLQIQKSKDFNINEATYFRIITDKTASLMAACCEIGAISASDNPDYHKAMKDYGELVGTAFQIQDDIFDYESHSSTIGKPVGNDLREKKITLPLIYSFSKVSRKSSKEILTIMKKKKIKKDEIKKIISFVRDNGGIDYSRVKAKEFSSRAVDILTIFKESPAKNSLTILSEFVVDRNL
ncbi:MAG: polyprenyl synthetase [Ignavibacteria bacterium GWB2_35_12]|nr:MAG: polyprenyl synthetase [Ignavibacteria bacterium GWA2_35_8]OGU42396.1 MAG: polyprenyl synthetase [Ignavibacteria bacterium GWB2_35_12]OGU97171.1 MAG: polyprenyl synthetase [Ignavibacteria bacterium RIFOXYA2_FULL_35_10]OGV19044.1 MAG: polyprenyl synthetase [Ignavibacteria bacterium RIFOXYC2_FULL_35_21]